MTETDLCNIALDHLAANRISSPDDASFNAQKIRLHWPLARDRALRAKEWNFAEKRALLTADATAPVFGYAYAYILPTDYLIARAFNDKDAGTSKADWEISGQFLLSNDTCSQLRYTFRNEVVTQWSAEFCDCFTLFLAAQVATALSASPELALSMRQRAEEAAIQATGPNARETRVRAIRAETDSHWLRARVGFSGPRVIPGQPTPAQWPNPL